MTKFSNTKRNQALRDTLAAKSAPKPRTVRTKVIPKPNTVNRQGFEAYSIDKWLRLVSMLNTLKLEGQFYRSESQTMKDLKVLVDSCAKENPYLVAQAIVYSRCVGEGMRSINHLAASYLAPYCSGLEWAKRFYSLWNKRTQSGGTVFRPDDMAEILACFSALNKTKATNSMKKGFADAIERLDSYQLLKYKDLLIDVINLVHPDPRKSKALVEYNGERVKAIDAIIRGYSVSADTWEVAQSDAGQEVAQAVKVGKITQAEADVLLTEAKAENWKDMLTEGKLGTLAAIRNLRNILLTVSDSATIDTLCGVLSDPAMIRKAKIMPHQIDIASEVVKAEFSNMDSRKILKALAVGYEAALPNLSEALIGRNLVIVDISGSMSMAGSNIKDPNKKTNYSTMAMDKAALIGATIAKATNADVIVFGSSAKYVGYNPNADVFTIASAFKGDLGGTNLSLAWQLAATSGKAYDRVFILSDNECNRGNTYTAYKQYVDKVGDPYVYSVDLAAYGTNSLAGPKVRYYYGFGFAMFDDIATVEFNPTLHLEKIRKIVI